MKTPKNLITLIAGTIIGAAGISALPETEPVIEISIPPTEQILELEKELKEREARGEGTTIILQKINELKQRLSP